MTTAAEVRRAERAAVAALQAATLFANYPADEVAAFLTTMAGRPQPDRFCRPRHVLHHPTDNPTESADLRGAEPHTTAAPRTQRGHMTITYLLCDGNTWQWANVPTNYIQTLSKHITRGGQICRTSHPGDCVQNANNVGFYTADVSRIQIDL